MASTRFCALFALALLAAQLAQAAVIPANNLFGSSTIYPSSLSPSGATSAPTDSPQDGNPPNSTLGYMPSFSHMPHSRPSDFPGDSPAPTDLPKHKFSPSYSQSDNPPANTSAFPSGAPNNGSAPSDHSHDSKSHEGHEGQPDSFSDHHDFSPTNATDVPTPTDNGRMPTESYNPPPSFSDGGVPSACPSHFQNFAVPAPTDLPAYNSSAGPIPQGCPTALPSSIWPSDGPAPTDTV
ncbi:uncharacterized protein LACBIDRAFT_312253 [Laccaria bicolor S238N-H82]|uniref:Predicted protein n=1 Tax=Laccaria bicolor (strain S238N-H82 / ATCC MYA-4686) TaxID=486041 RepID=B0DVT6_LACBS|nr:uncharacterized protein LACBIDRAFT_312253 [Laccaria bicolor S238N-H82]EDR01357.1 predicted protein [Laccaria bicolor S238N-H82]|eukprot:XP_001888064.1 predicted protein [Laccaria bicolor S238N-H82]